MQGETAIVAHDVSDDAMCSNPNVTDTQDAHVVILGQDRVHASVTHTVTTGVDGSGWVSDSTLTYVYDAQARVTGAKIGGASWRERDAVWLDGDGVEREEAEVVVMG